MNDRWSRINDLFLEVLSMSPADRAEFLRKISDEDPQIRQEIEQLLLAVASTREMAPTIDPPGQPMRQLEAGADVPPVAPPSPGREAGPERVGDRIGNYRILEHIGEGGFGMVYMAEQERPVRRRVALKIIKAGMDTRQVIARFEQERQALAMMDHPNIAKVLDAGTTVTGRPFFVMELVKGVPITRYCDDARLSMSDRLEIFTSVCHAVQHAHHKGVIHRDIKPSNVLVTNNDGRPIAKVIDFGVAKATHQPLTEKTLFTEYRQLVGTPEYMSPEQADSAGMDIDTRTDVYSLGVLLYELLVGVTPFDGRSLRSKGYAEMQRLIREQDPPKPSTRFATLGDQRALIADHRREHLASFGRRLGGELEWIVMKCLDKDRTRRYDTPAALSEDILRLARDEPVVAAPESTAYRLRKLARKHRGALATVLAVGSALAIGTGAMAFGLVQARRERSAAELARADAVQAREKIAGQAKRALRQNELLEKYLLTPLPVGADPQAAAAGVIRDAEGVFGPSDPKVAGVLAGVGALLAGNIARGSEAQAVLQMALEEQRRSLGEQSGAQAMPYTVLAAMATRDDPENAVALTRKALAISENSKPPDLLQIASNHECLALLLLTLRDTKAYSEAETHYRAAMETYQQFLGPLHARTLETSLGLAQTLFILGQSDESLRLFEANVEPAMKNVQVRDVIRLSTYSNLSQLYQVKHQTRQAIDAYSRLAQIVNRMYSPGSTIQKRTIAAIANAIRELGDGTAADQVANTAFVGGQQPPPAALYQAAASSIENSQWKEAMEKLADLSQTLPRAVDPLLLPAARYNVERLSIRALSRSGEKAGAVERAKAFVRSVQKEFGTGNERDIFARALLAETTARAGDADAAKALFAEARRLALEHSPPLFTAAQELAALQSRILKESGDEAGSVECNSEFERLVAADQREPRLGGFEDQELGGAPQGWLVPNAARQAGQIVIVDETRPNSGKYCVRVDGLEGVDQVLETSRGFRNIIRSFDAKDYRGKRVRFSAAVRVHAPQPGPDSRAQLWLRVDRPNFAKPALFDNMDDRPIKSEEWATYDITGVVNDDAESIVVGLMVFGGVTAWLDDVKLEVLDAPPSH